MSLAKRPFAEVDDNGDHRQETLRQRPTPPQPSPDRRGRWSADSDDFPDTLSPWQVDETPPQAFEADASIVLVGIRGAGKSTLAIIASTAMNRRVVDCEKAFQQATNFSSSVFKRLYGPLECRRRQTDVLRDTLANSCKGCIIVCSWMEKNIRRLLQDFCRTNPVVHILRESDVVQRHLKIEDEAKASNLIALSTSLFRGSSNFEFFNLSENLSRHVDTQTDTTISKPRSPAPYLALKRAERHFLKFLTLIMPAGSIPFIESAFPLASVPTHERKFTYALSVTLSSLLAREIDTEEMEIGADAIEIVVDDLVCGPGEVGSLTPERAALITNVLGSIRRNTVIPLIYHVLRPENGPSRPFSSNPQTIYVDYVLHGLRLAPEFVTVDLQLNESVFKQVASLRRNSRVIAHCAPMPAFPWDSPDWLRYYEKARKFDCDMVRLVKPAYDMQDNFDVQRFRASADLLGEPRIPIIAYNTGRLGRHSACFNPILSPITTAAGSGDFTRLESSYHPQLTAIDGIKALYSSFVYDPMKLYVFGANVSYSLSPTMHNAALAAYGIQHVYRPYSTPTLGGLKGLVDDPFFAGASVGLPFKVEIITITDSLSRHARAIGACNTLIPIRHLNSDGSVPDDSTLLFNSRNRAGPIKALYGENTDWIGIRACIRRGLSPANAVRPASCGLVIGAGGMARAAVYAMLQLGVKNIVIYNRTVANAEKLARHFRHLLSKGDLPQLDNNSTVNISHSSRSSGTSSPASTPRCSDARFHIVRSLDDAASQEWPPGFTLPTMIVSCIPTHEVNNTPPPNYTLPPAWLASPTGGVFFELEYKTLDSPLHAQFRREAHRGWVVMDGLDLLPEQGFAQFELFTGRRAPRRLMRRVALRAWSDELGRSGPLQLEPRLRNIVEQEP
ncbi:hypothetical protein MCOR27_008137 [Pyricularia oryzae]|uniref:Quinate repressor protein n=4 Tax=Pyricularia TaxID=48558 RepID=A0ABQ8NJD9_PYRGI|nr:quinate repressor [Pyricularia oryzae Y34]KAH8848367.1 hypothetical protein MCOR01_001744 [Pyricularia oryzae]KAI6298034.1 hypothetical protein MCOR33_005745 [Pyricularia grisea]KAH9429687.1 hypothetical protein MCOR02_009424 [Pyricularia oryzae]KAI6263118.1 hypothetical protein MCOR19_000758 [Pyricularia oryzae]